MIRVLVCFSLLFASCQTASASILYGTTGTGRTTGSTLYEIDPVTGVQTLIGSVGYVVTGMDYYDGIMYGVTGTGSSFHGLITINLTTGVGTPVGSGWGSLPDDTIAELAIDDSGNAYGWSEGSLDDAGAIDLGTGTMTGIIGDSGLGTASLGLAIDSSGRLILVNFSGDIHEIDTVTGGSTFVGSIGATAHHGDVDPDTGLYYGLDFNDPASLIVVDLSSASVLSSVLTSGPNRVHTLAFAPGAAVVPEPATLTLMFSGALCGVFHLRRKKIA